MRLAAFFAFVALLIAPIATRAQVFYWPNGTIPKYATPIVCQDPTTGAITNCVSSTTASNATIVGPLGSQTSAASVATTLNGSLPPFASTPAFSLSGTGAVNATADTHAQCSALCANLVVKASAGVLKTFEVSADATLSGAIWYVIVYDATAAPSDGAVTPAKCYQQASGTTQMGGTLGPGGSSMLTGIVIGVSSTGCFTKTASTHAFIAADYQ